MVGTETVVVMENILSTVGVFQEFMKKFAALMESVLLTTFVSVKKNGLGLIVTLKKKIGNATVFGLTKKVFVTDMEIVFSQEKNEEDLHMVIVTVTELTNLFVNATKDGGETTAMKKKTLSNVTTCLHTTLKYVVVMENV